MPRKRLCGIAHIKRPLILSTCPRVGKVSLSGATIIRVGSPEEDGIEGGGLAIDYRRPPREERRIIFGFNERGMWIIGEGRLGEAAMA
jgi:hypothetical protein